MWLSFSFFFFFVRYQDQLDILHAAHKAVSENNDFTVIEGTGHTAVGSIVGLNNARVAAELGVPVILVCNGGIGSSVDEIELNRQLCLGRLFLPRVIGGYVLVGAGFRPRARALPTDARRQRGGVGVGAGAVLKQ